MDNGERAERLIPNASRSAATSLVGTTLTEGWRVTALMPRPDGHSTGHYSVSYCVENEDGRQGFLKALDYSKAFQLPDPALLLNAMTEAYLHERQVLARCSSRKLRHIVRALGGGATTVPGFETPVNYIIFERADCDLRAQMDAADMVDDAWRINTLHQVATGLFELHGSGIAHQDVKPANVLQFGTGTTKVADLGRSACRDLACPYESDVIPGTRAYAPPELLYRSPAADFVRRRFGCDAYLLGSMAVYLFTGISATALLMGEIAAAHRPAHWNDGFSSVLPYLKAGFARVLENLERRLVVPAVKGHLLQMIAELCEPDPAYRGHPLNRPYPERQYSLERYVTRTDVMAKQLDYLVVRGR